MEILTGTAERLILQRRCKYSPKVVILCKMQQSPYLSRFLSVLTVYLSHHIFVPLHSSAMQECS